jgi:DNA-binding winged helix-turn-helix (wHTH) protein
LAFAGNECIIDRIVTSTGSRTGQPPLAKQPSMERAHSMPSTLRLTNGGFMRRSDVRSIIQFLYNLQCVELVGFSNVGKSAFMRLLAQPDVWTQELGETGRDFLPVYIDCNSMLAMNDHGFYELVLRTLQESSPALAGLPELATAYATMVAPSSEFQVPLSFNRGLNAVLQSTPYKLILLFDEFDEPFARIDSRVFINLRAFKDRHGARLVYVTATEQPLAHRRPEDHCGEFCELFSHHTWHLAPLTRPDVERFVHSYMTAFEVPFTTTDIDFLYHWAGGHPRLLNGACGMLEEALDEANTVQAEPAERWPLYEQLIPRLRVADELNSECDKIWQKLSPAEQEALTALRHAVQPSHEAVLVGLLRQHIVVKVEGKYQPFCALFADYIQRQTTSTPPAMGRLWVDNERGLVIVNGEPVEALTNLEYRLISLLFANRDKLIDKYQIVTHVWGESYIDEVDDARIEKLVSRLRQKIEPDPSSPRYLTTIRGRGYKLTVN